MRGWTWARGVMWDGAPVAVVRTSEPPGQSQPAQAAKVGGVSARGAALHGVRECRAGRAPISDGSSKPAQKLRHGRLLVARVDERARARPQRRKNVGRASAEDKRTAE